MTQPLSMARGPTAVAELALAIFVSESLVRGLLLDFEIDFDERAFTPLLHTCSARDVSDEVGVCDTPTPAGGNEHRAPSAAARLGGVEQNEARPARDQHLPECGRPRSWPRCAAGRHRPGDCGLANVRGARGPDRDAGRVHVPRSDSSRSALVDGARGVAGSRRARGQPRGGRVPAVPQRRGLRADL